MAPSRYSVSRQKACQQCCSAKAKCDRKPGICTRCSQRGLNCVYASTSSRAAENRRSPAAARTLEAYSPYSESSLANHTEVVGMPTPSRETFPNDAMIQPFLASPGSTASNIEIAPTIQASPIGRLHVPLNHRIGGRVSDVAAIEKLNFSSLDLQCPINPDDISNRWLNTYVPVPGQVTKNYPPNITIFISRVLKSYTSVAIQGRGFPPFVHACQIRAQADFQPLATCLGVVRICDSPLSGTGTSSVALEVLQREMQRIYELREADDSTTVLAAFQAYLIYVMVLFFQVNDGAGVNLREAMMNLQELACATSRQGLVPTAEMQRCRPGWEAWIVCEAKRRTLFTMYLFDNVLSSHDGLPTFLGTELTGLAAPAGKALWNASSRAAWETACNIHLAEWPEGGLRIDELWPLPPGLDEEGIAKRQKRLEQWLEGVEEYGTMMYAVTCGTHGT